MRTSPTSPDEPVVTVCLGELASTQYGVSMALDPEGTTRIVGMQHVRDGEILLSDLPRVTLSEAERAAFLLREGDLLFNRTNSYEQVGKTGLVRRPDAEGAVFASYLVRLRVDRRRIMPEFLNYWMNSPSAVAALRALATPGVSQFNINPTALRERLRVPLPSLASQASVVTALDTCDQHFRLMTSLSRARRRFRLGLMQKLFGKAQRPHVAGAEWHECRLGDLFTERVESGRGDLPLLAITADRGIVARDEIARRDTSNADKGAYLRICAGDIGYNTMRMWQGVSALSTLEGIISPAYTVCTPGPNVDAAFAAHYFKFPPIVDVFRRHSQGLVDDTLNLKFHHFARIRLAFPALDEQRALAGLLTLLDDEIRLLDQLAAALDLQKRSLLERLLSGTIRVPAA